METIKSAKEMWCPMARESCEGFSANRDYEGSLMRGTCVADDCMLWRWNEDNTMGFCGLAGEIGT